MAHETNGPRKGEVKFENCRAYFDSNPDEDDENDDED